MSRLRTAFIRGRAYPAIAILVGAGFLALAWLYDDTLAALVGSLRDAYRAAAPVAFREAVYRYVHRTADLLFDPVVYALVAVVCLLERRFPAQPNQPLLSRGLAQDYAWFVAEKLSTIDVVLSTATHFQLRSYKHDGFMLNHLYTDGPLPVSP